RPPRRAASGARAGGGGAGTWVGRGGGRVAGLAVWAVGWVPASPPGGAAAWAPVRVIGAAVSCSAEIGTIPVLLIRPTVGLMPTMPQACAGLTLDPSVSVPTASGVSPAATATAEPELEPDGLRPEPCGLTACPPSVDQPLDDWVERKLAHSDRLALPRMTASAARSLPIRKAS